jgi:hypothetical protein
MSYENWKNTMEKESSATHAALDLVSLSLPDRAQLGSEPLKRVTNLSADQMNQELSAGLSQSPYLIADGRNQRSGETEEQYIERLQRNERATQMQKFGPAIDTITDGAQAIVNFPQTVRNAVQHMRTENRNRTGCIQINHHRGTPCPTGY